ncbi:MAG: DUF1134 domain-containing protein [Caulobacterales bacterium]
MDRRLLIVSGLAAAAAARPALAQDADPHRDPDRATGRDQDRDRDRDRGPDDTGPSEKPAEPYSRDEIVGNVSDFLGVTAENAGAGIEKTFRDNGRPTAYIAGTEGSGAFFLGLRYGEGLMYMKNRPRLKVFWQGPSGGFDIGGNASRVFILCYNLQYPDAIFRRFPGVEGSAYLVGGMGVNYQRAEEITLAPVRAGVGFRLGANVGYLSYSRSRHIIPL